MGMWSILEDERADYGRGFGMRDAAEEAYHEGCKHGYEKALREMQGGMGFRDGGNYGSGSGSYGNRGYFERSGMGERRMMPPYYPEYPMMGMREDMDEMGERRHRRANGQFY